VRKCDAAKCYTIYTVPANLKPYWDAIQGDPLPRVAIAPLGGGAVRDFPMPADSVALYKLLGEQK
jgi:hypothetical protein